MSIINGYSYSKFQIIDPNGREATINISLPLTNLNGGLVETYDVRKIEHELIGLDINNPAIEINQNIMGWFIMFDFSFQDFINGETLMLFKTIIEKAKIGRTIRLFPRSDEMWRFYDVIFKSDNFSIGLRRGGSNVKYHKLFTASFMTKVMQTELNWQLTTTQETEYGGTTIGSPLEGQQQI